MRNFIMMSKGFLTDETGATMVEYALMVTLIAIVAAVGAGTLGGAINTQFAGVAGSL